MTSKFWFFDPMLIVQFFVLVNPLYSFPLLMTAHQKRLNVRRIAVNATVTAYLIALVVALCGPFLFRIFGISLDSLRIAGGIVVMLLGLETVRAREDAPSLNHANTLVAIVASPMLTGPATISFVTLQVFDLGRWPVLLNMFVAFILIGITFVGFSYIVPKVNERLVNITSRVMGLFLTAVAIEMIAKGVTGILQIKH